MENNSQIVFASPTVRIGTFRCPPESSRWHTENVNGNLPELVFPRTAVRIKQADRRSVIASPNHVMFYNSRQSYHREMISHRGDRCEFYAVDPETLVEALRGTGSRLTDRIESPFLHSHGPCSAEIYFLQRSLFRYCRSEPTPDPIYVEETFLQLLARISALAEPKTNSPENVRRERTVAGRRQKVEHAVEYVSRNFQTNLGLAEIADAVDSSVFHLCRIFKASIGLSLHQYISQLRIRATLEDLFESKRCLTQVALDYGFSSHSHFTNSFRTVFGFPPSRLRESDVSSLISGMISMN